MQLLHNSLHPAQLLKQVEQYLKYISYVHKHFILKNIKTDDNGSTFSLLQAILRFIENFIFLPPRVALIIALFN